MQCVPQFDVQLPEPSSKFSNSSWCMLRTSGATYRLRAVGKGAETAGPSIAGTGVTWVTPFLGHGKRGPRTFRPTGPPERGRLAPPKRGVWTYFAGKADIPSRTDGLFAT